MASLRSTSYKLPRVVGLTRSVRVLSEAAYHHQLGSILEFGLPSSFKVSHEARNSSAGDRAGDRLWCDMLIEVSARQRIADRR